VLVMSWFSMLDVPAVAGMSGGNKWALSRFLPSYSWRRVALGLVGGYIYCRP
jgi:hypothetical protein